MFIGQDIGQAGSMEGGVRHGGTTTSLKTTSRSSRRKEKCKLRLDNISLKRSESEQISYALLRARFALLTVYSMRPDFEAKEIAR